MENIFDQKRINCSISNGIAFPVNKTFHFLIIVRPHLCFLPFSTFETHTTMMSDYTEMRQRDNQNFTSIKFSSEIPFHRSPPRALAFLYSLQPNEKFLTFYVLRCDCESYFIIQRDGNTRRES